MNAAESGLRKRATVVATATRFVDGACLSLFMAVAPLLALTEGASLAVATMLAGVGYAIWLLGLPVSGWLSDRVGRRGVIRGGLVINFVGTILPLAFGGLWTLFVSRALTGAGSANSVAASAVFADISSADNRGKMMALRQAASSAGLVVGPLLALAVTSNGLLTVFATMAVLIMANLLLTLLMPETHKPGEATAPPKPVGGIVAAALTANFLPLLLTCFLVTFAFALVHSSLPLILGEVFVGAGEIPVARLLVGAGHSEVVSLTVAAMLCSTGAALVAQILLSARLMRRYGPWAVMVASCGVWAGVQVLTPAVMANGWIPYLATVLVSGACFGFFYPALATQISLRAGASLQGRGFAAMDMAVGAGMLSAPMVSGAILSMSPDYVYWHAGAGMSLAAAVGLFLVRETLQSAVPRGAE